MRQLDALDHRHARAREHFEWVTGLVVSAVANHGFLRPKKWLSPRDYGLGPRLRTKPKKSIEVDEQDQAARLRVLFRGLVAQKEAKNG